MAWARELYEDLQKFQKGGTYLNFPGFSEEGTDQLRQAFGANYDKLRRVKAKYDPPNLFRANLNIQPLD